MSTQQKSLNVTTPHWLYSWNALTSYILVSTQVRAIDCKPPSPLNIKSVSHRWCTIRPLPSTIMRTIDCAHASLPSTWPTTTKKGKQNDVGTIDLRVTCGENVFTAVRKVNIRLLHDNSRTQVRFLWASHDASSNPFSNKFVRDTRSLNVCVCRTLPFQSLQYEL